ncbi:GNAT family N-acetyltransferase [Aspergillus neoniger CBS 115656]|uniref:Acetyltransferase, GNAT family n=1 Tax=Aspergillus neoniger (strain CBS 115656) TaxID=1448310 RepID=A0A318YLS3_ASPNB|nr:acetyltransferase, GNAT family [Aspergillus neoniger CBS 115656]PYH35144.1 acetyltransferase, GNAT family [Aspergillus neoniger CBS 115656]
MPKTCIRPQLQTRLISTPSQPKPTPARSHQKPQQDDLRIIPATPSDSPAIADVFLHAFSDPFSRRMFPITEDVRSFWVDQFKHEIEQSRATATPRTAFLKVTAGEEGTVAAFAKWWYPVPEEVTSDGEKNQTKTVWPPSSDADLCERFFGLMNSEKKRVMGGRKEGYFYLDMLGTLPQFNGRGIGSRLLRWGLDRADEKGVPTFLASTPAGRPLYEKYGFEAVEEYEVIPGYFQASMVREAKFL